MVTLDDVARRYEINVTSPPMYLVNNHNPRMHGVLEDAGTPTVNVEPARSQDIGFNIPDLHNTQNIPIM